jgi:hypothetical protein
LVEHELEILLRPHFFRNGDDTWAELTGEHGPLRGFYSKIVTAYAFGICDSVGLENIHIVRKIRNVFAHSKRPINFNNDLVVKELKTVHLPKRGRLYNDLSLVKNLTFGPQLSYVSLCILLAGELINRGALRAQKKLYRYKRTAKKRQSNVSQNPFFSALYPYASGLLPFLKEETGSNPLSSLARQSDDPKSEAPLGLLGEWVQSQSKKDDKTGK